MTTRRGFLASILAAGYAPAAIGSGVLMPVRQIVVPDHAVATVDWVNGQLGWVSDGFLLCPPKPMTIAEFGNVALACSSERASSGFLP